MDQARSHFVQMNGMRFHYLTWGDPSCPLLICLHGLRSYGGTFAGLAETLSDRFHVVALDQRGRGESDWDPDRNYFALDYAADLDALLDHLGAETAHVLGHSMGGINALAYALDKGDRFASLILEDSGPEAADKESAGIERILNELRTTPLSFDTIAEARAFWRSIRPNVTDEAIESRVANSMKQADGKIVWRHDQAGIGACRIAQAETRPNPDLWPAIERLTCPVLVLRGENSDYLDRARVARMRAANANVHAQDITGAGHYVHDDNPVEFNTAVGAFLDRVIANRT
ncbi:alpha/beta fold hydrolase [Pseudooceanicola sp. 216_PA32_1]|uniref:Alpha/beta fold hydrolase n=1 Tax=Pseudooceanicola pacificus TaxID=2676438 RepID=A0A844WDE0_9RHOB|nr:alpha/beta hydrolase [Pseudooceanicola pacificus]MWB79178.1 alpha/beta fold hydrolase [Pseudooceanicola pacificus]